VSKALVDGEGMERWLRTDEQQEVISSLRMVLRSMESASEDLDHWKWAVIALHNAVQGAMVMSLRAGNDFRVMPEKLAQKCYQAHMDSKPWPKAKMDSFPNLYKKAQSQETMGFYVHSRQLPSDPDRDRCIAKLLDLRNSFIHFMPQGWSLEVSGLPEICETTLEMIHFLCWESGNVFWHGEFDSMVAQELVSKAKNIAQKLRAEYVN